MKAVILNNEIIHIGEWEKTINTICVDDNGTEVIEIIDNPTPDGAIEGDFEIIVKDEKYILASDYKKLRKLEYPPIEEYLDAVVKSDDVAIQQYKDKCLAVKEKYPKV